MQSNYAYYWSEWYNLNNPNCNAFRTGALDYFNVPCYSEWYGIAIKNDDDDGWAMDKIVYNGVNIDSFRDMTDNWSDYFWIKTDTVHERYVYFDKNGIMISYDESYTPIYRMY